MLQSFQHYFGMTVKIRNNRVFHRFFLLLTVIPKKLFNDSNDMVGIPVNFTPKNYTSRLNFEKKKFSIPERGLRFDLKIDKRPFWDVGRNFFFLWKKKLTIVFFGVKFTGDYRNVAILSSLFRDHSQNSKKPNFSSFFRLFTVIPK